MGQNEEAAWWEQFKYWEDKRDILKTEKKYWDLKLQMLKRADIDLQNMSRI